MPQCGERRRFSPLLLSHEEYFFQDFGAEWGGSSGWVHVCSQSLVLDPRQHAEPVLRVRWDDVRELAPAQQPHAFTLTTNRIYLVREGSKPHAHRVLPGATLTITLTITPLCDVLPFLRKLEALAHIDDSVLRKQRLDAVIRTHESTTTFDLSWIADHRETVQLPGGHALLCNKVTPLIKTPGWFLITDRRIYFQSLNSISLDPVEKHALSQLTHAYPRKHGLHDTSMELFFSGGSVLLLAFGDDMQQHRDAALQVLRGQLLSPAVPASMQTEWVQGRASTYDYLLYLNHCAGRTVNDLAQYPVFPWVIQDYTSPHLDLENPATFRDLTKPIGALNPDRLAHFEARMRDMGSEGGFLYGTHYSTPAYVVYFLVRQHPEYMLCLQNGRFDEPDRFFLSIASTWESCYTNRADVKELIPEFYDMSKRGVFLMNRQRIDFGKRQNGKPVGHVQLPLWASSPAEFVRLMRKALESRHVSAHLHHWIDLVFGYSSRGDAARSAKNLFHPSTYSDTNVELLDEQQRHAVEQHLFEFGHAPRQLFVDPHPPREA